ncbi:GD16286 [Drosophila simulans]|uniref:GD16286 n=1 Tax=Drosophila simulans TaxID=7240 RepID=B4R4J6_DROSI|nr:GD16286 [Drosophila simulans]
MSQTALPELSYTPGDLTEPQFRLPSHQELLDQKVLVVPRPRQPYAKKNYDIETLVPPFQSQAGGAGQGGYPEHWRLASVYQHAYKPIDQRRRPLLQTVYK